MVELVLNADCTFQPTVTRLASENGRNTISTKSRTTLLYENSYKYHSKRQELADRAGEDRECTFAPNTIKTRTSEMYARSAVRHSRGPRHETLYKQAESLVAKKAKAKEVLSLSLSLILSYNIFSYNILSPCITSSRLL